LFILFLLSVFPAEFNGRCGMPTEILKRLSKPLLPFWRGDFSALEQTGVEHEFGPMTVDASFTRSAPLPAELVPRLFVIRLLIRRQDSAAVFDVATNPPLVKFSSFHFV
jgi:hypothetical protein